MDVLIDWDFAVGEYHYVCSDLCWSRVKEKGGVLWRTKPIVIGHSVNGVTNPSLYALQWLTWI